MSNSSFYNPINSHNSHVTWKFVLKSSVVNENNSVHDYMLNTILHL